MRTHHAYTDTNLGYIILVVLIDEAGRLVGVPTDGLVAPPLLQITSAVEPPAAVVEAVRQLVAQNRAYRAVVQGPDIKRKEERDIR